MIDRADQYAALRERTKAYASRIIRLYTVIQQEQPAYSAALIIGKQLLHSGTSVAANHRESKHARSKADLVAKIAIILQELEESLLWLELLHEHHMAHSGGLIQLIEESNQLISIFITSSRKLKS
jgi:four helix bundle protein